MFGKLNDGETEALLFSQATGRVGCHAAGTTYIVPISYAYDGAYIYGHTSEGQKLNFMRSNPKVCFEVDSLTDMANWQTVICQGIFEELTEGTERNKALKILLDRNLPFIASKAVQLTEHWPFAPADVTAIPGVVYRILLTEKTGRFERYTNEFNQQAG